MPCFQFPKDDLGGDILIERYTQRLSPAWSISRTEPSVGRMPFAIRIAPKRSPSSWGSSDLFNVANYMLLQCEEFINL